MGYRIQLIQKFLLFGMKENTIASSSASQCLRKRKKQRKTFLTVLRIFPRLLKTKLIDVGAQYYIQCGYPDVAKEFVQACTDKEIVGLSEA